MGRGGRLLAGIAILRQRRRARLNVAMGPGGALQLAAMRVGADVCLQQRPCGKGMIAGEIL
jgi:hypothetical protein